MRYLVKTLDAATEDIKGIHEWLARRSLSGAESWYRTLARAIGELAVAPDRHPLAPEAASSPRQIRQVLFHTTQGNKYRLLFTIVDDEVRVLRVRGPGQPPLRRKDFLN
jgi:plasmid stabilization system protein ParE